MTIFIINLCLSLFNLLCGLANHKQKNQKTAAFNYWFSGFCLANGICQLIFR